MVASQLWMILLGGHDLPPGHNICQWDGLVTLPLLHNLLVLDEDDEALVAALVEDLGVACGALHLV